MVNVLGAAIGWRGHLSVGIVYRDDLRLENSYGVSLIGCGRQSAKFIAC
jgi:hypothetical protein